MITANDIPLDVCGILSRIQSIAPLAVIGGGALRDADNDRPVKDLDIFIPCRGEADAVDIMFSLGKLDFAVSYEQSQESMYPEDQNLEVVAVAEMGITAAGTPIQLIFTNHGFTKQSDRFDYGICQIEFDGKELYRSEAYLEDQQRKVFRLARDRETPMAMRGSIHRYARLVQKYPEWTWWPYEVSPDPFSVFDFVDVSK